ncbi:MAG: DUF4878 domain-containing protein [Prevotellaceae bacterium]|jgi:hypothetical protein|nr:DUF4878 domain-containing protein [Prevotellaceae bacterium]
MKNKLKTLLFAVLASMVFIGCGGGGNLSPKEVAEKAINAAKNYDYKTLKNYVVKSQIPAIEEAEKSNDESSEDKELRESAIFEVISETISDDGNSATVNVKITVGDNSFENDLDLVKEDGQWKVSDKLL